MYIIVYLAKLQVYEYPWSFDMGTGVSEPSADNNVQIASCETSLSDSQISSNLFDITT
jgi:hypothetical protein